jgi:hypothetical protein
MDRIPRSYTAVETVLDPFSGKASGDPATRGVEEES